MTIQATVTIWCDKCGSMFTYKPPPRMTVQEAVVVAREKAAEAGWEVGDFHYFCPACVSLEKHPAQWTKEAGSEHVPTLEGG